MQHFTPRKRARKWIAVTLAAAVLLAGPGLSPAFGEGNGPGTSLYLPLVSGGVDTAPAQQTNSVTVAPVEPPLLESKPQSSNAGGEKIARTAAHIQSLAVRTADPRDMKVLMICPNAQEPAYQAGVAFLQQIGIPYTALLASQTNLTSSMLFDGSKAFYQGVILCSGSLYPTGVFESAFDATEWQTLWDFEAMFGIRQVTLYTAPGVPESYGLSLADGRYASPEAPVSATLTAAGQQVFNDLKADATISIKNAWVYFATVISPAVTTPLLVTPEGYAIASVTTYPDGRQNLAVTADNSPYLIHSMALSYGILNWLTKGIFLGERHANLGIQVDDLFNQTDLWNPANKLIENTGITATLTGADIAADLNRRNSVIYTQYPLANTLKLEFAFNGEGAPTQYRGLGLFQPDTLTPAILANKSQYNFVNHTYTHLNLDAPTTASAILTELNNNQRVATALGLTNYSRDTMVQPDISGIGNPAFIQAARSFGIKYGISDTSRPGGNNPSPNAGIYTPTVSSWFQPSILLIPRHPTNLFYPVATPEQWVDMYNCFYSRQYATEKGACANGQFLYWNDNLTYDQILDKESDVWLGYVMRWDLDPMMFHIAQVKTYDGSRSVLNDLIERMLQKYHALSNLKIRNLPQHDIGGWMDLRMSYNASGITATLTPCKSITYRSSKTAIIPMTGIANGLVREVYNGQNIGWLLSLGFNIPLTLNLPACPATTSALAMQAEPATEPDFAPALQDVMDLMPQQ